MHARATFFEEGRHVAGREELMRQILAAGDEIGNHSYRHPHDPGPRELSSTDAAIRTATGFTPCLFRPPYGLVNAKVEAAALDQRLQTILGFRFVTITELLGGRMLYASSPRNLG